MPPSDPISSRDAGSIIVHYTIAADGPMLSSIKPSSSIPFTTYIISYLNEGGANFVFKISPLAHELHDSTSQSPDVVGSSPKIHGKLLRLRKDLASSSPTADQYQAYNDVFVPMFPKENLVDLDLITLSKELPGVINDFLPRLCFRPVHRQHDFVPVDETLSLLVTDMTPGANDMLLQVKPKWLAQSPNAPEKAKRCRTCALRALRASKQIRTATDTQGTCPLKLVSDDIDTRRQAVEYVTRDERLREFLITDAQPLLKQLREHQRQLDQFGVFAAASVSGEDKIVSDLCKAMTIRDCTLFLRKSENGGEIEARLADLDLKQPEKMGRWMNLESDLVEGGWYTNVEDSSVRQEEKMCFLAQPAGHS
nr:inositol-pentakisphosphate 2-kinase [Quercus suber]